jgi:hypothetical protein
MSVMTSVFFTPLMRHYAADAFGGTAAVFLAASLLLLCAAVAMAVTASRVAGGKITAVIENIETRCHDFSNIGCARNHSAMKSTKTRTLRINGRLGA